MTEVNTPSERIGVRTAPIPSPVTVRSGEELYKVPPFRIITSVIAPFEIIGDNWAFLPETNLTVGGLLKLTISDDP